MERTLQPIRTPWATKHPRLTNYYDTEWGMPVTSERGIFERLTLEAFQSGLSWLTILQRRDAFRKAFAQFDPEQVASFDAEDVERLLQDASIIRNRRKIEATIANARATLEARDDIEGGLPALIWSYIPERSPVFAQDEAAPSDSPESKALAKVLKARGFAMVGPTTMYALMSAIGMVDLHAVDSHRRGCSGLWNADGTRSSQAVPFSAEG